MTLHDLFSNLIFSVTRSNTRVYCITDNINLLSIQRHRYAIVAMLHRLPVDECLSILIQKRNLSKALINTRETKSN